jgi:hypothetical protein
VLAGTSGYSTIMRLDAAGTLLWEHCSKTARGSAIRAVWPLRDGGFAAAGEAPGLEAPRAKPATGERRKRAGSEGYLLKLDSAGTVQWEQTYPFGELREIRSVLETPGGGLQLAGWTGEGDAEATFVMGVSADGDSLWSRPGGKGRLRELVPLQDGGSLLLTVRPKQDGDGTTTLVRLAAPK